MGNSGWNLSGRGAVVTGGARGIGQAIAQALLAAGAQVHVFDLAEPDSGACSSFQRVDVADSRQVQAAVAALPAGTTLLVNDAGITRDRTLIKMSDEEWDCVLAVNLKGPFNLIRAMAPAMIAAGAGRIVNVSSINGLRGGQYL